MKKLQASTKDATERFDETLTKLFEKKVKCEMAIYQVSQHTGTHTHAAHVCDTWTDSEHVKSIFFIVLSSFR